MADCDNLIKQDITKNCVDPVVKGVEANGVIINRDDIDYGSIIKDATQDNIIKTLLLLAQKRGYKVYSPGATPFTGTKSTLAVATYANTYTRELPIVVLDHGPEVCSNVIEPLGSGSGFVAIIENKHKGTNGKSAFEIYGLEQGLVASAQEQDKYSEDFQGGWTTTLQETGAKRAAIFYFNTDYATTKAALNTLTQPAA